MGRVYKVDEKRFTLLDLDELTGGELSELQKLTGIRGYPALVEALIEQNVDSTMGVIYLSLKRDDPTVEYADVERRLLTDYVLADDVGVDPTQTPEANGTGASDGSTSTHQPTLAG